MSGTVSPTPVTGPIANATPGAWQTASLNGMQYQLLLPANYDPSTAYPVLLFLHQLDNASQIPYQIDPWFNTTEFRTNYPAIVVAPQLDQSADPSGVTINWGGVSSDVTAGENGALAVLRKVMSDYSSDPSRIYVTGDSMGGIGTWDMMIEYNAWTGTDGRIFAAGLPLAGANYEHGYPTPDAAVVEALRNVPIWAIHGAYDTSVPTLWDRAMADWLSGSPTFHYTEDPNLGHDVWDTYYPLPNGKEYFDWLFSQKAGGTDPKPPVDPPTPSPDGTVIRAGDKGAIVDTDGNEWTIRTDGRIAVNGVADQTTARVTTLAIVDGRIWQQNQDALWWSKTGPTASWEPPYGTDVSPLPTDPPPDSSGDTVIHRGDAGVILDAAGNRWTINDRGRIAVNDRVDTTTRRVTTLARVDDTIWQQNQDGLWWSKTDPSGSWEPPDGTDVSPLPDTLLVAGSTGLAASSTDIAAVPAADGTTMRFMPDSASAFAASGDVSATGTPATDAHTYVIPPAGSGDMVFIADILQGGDKLDLRPALADTDWNGDPANLGHYIAVSPSPDGTVIGIAPSADAPAMPVATLGGEPSASLSLILAHAIT
ncbi:MAG: hypothetical protein AB7F35_17170 [Acetobacteraceae bacterium]